MVNIALSVVVPNFNHARYLISQLDAVFSNTRPPDEVIVIDDASTDNSREILRNYASSHPKLRVIENEKNLGVIASFNRAIDQVRGKYICIIAADDKVLPQFFEKAMAQLEKHPQAGICLVHPAYLHDKTGKIIPHRASYPALPGYFNPDETADLILKGIWLAGHATILRTDLVIECGKFDAELKWHSDWFLNHMIAGKHGMCFDPVLGSALRILETSYSAAGRRDPMAQGEVLWRIVERLQSPKFAELRPFFMKARLFSHFEKYQDDLAGAIVPWAGWGQQHRERLERIETILWPFLRIQDLGRAMKRALRSVYHKLKD